MPERIDAIIGMIEQEASAFFGDRDIWMQLNLAIAKLRAARTLAMAKLIANGQRNCAGSRKAETGGDL